MKNTSVCDYYVFGDGEAWPISFQKRGVMIRWTNWFKECMDEQMLNKWVNEWIDGCWMNGQRHVG